MDKETLSNYGWIVICVLVLAVMIALATPFGSYVADGFKAAYKGFGDTNTEVTDMMYSAVGGTKVPASCGIEGHYKGDNRGTHGIPATDCPKGHKYTCECVSWIVPEGGTYTMDRAVNGKKVYNAGEALPNHYAPIGDDIYENEDYKYIYGINYNPNWSVEVKDKTKTEYGEILSEIAGKPVNYMKDTFKNCTSLTTAPVIPNSVTHMIDTFRGCTSLTTAPVIPNNVTYISGTFRGCTSLTTAPEISNSVTSMYDIFENCTSLTTAPVIPNSVTEMTGTFFGCTSLTKAPIIPNSVTSMSSTFSKCTSLTTAPVIPSSVTDISNAFYGCTSLTTAPVIPNGVTNMITTFENCTSLTTAPVIPSSVTNMLSTFHGCTSLTAAPVIPSSVTDMMGTFWGCTSLTKAPIIPNSVTEMRYTFLECTALTGTIEINANPTKYDKCLNGTQITAVTGSTTLKARILATK